MALVAPYRRCFGSGHRGFCVCWEAMVIDYWLLLLPSIKNQRRGGKELRACMYFDSRSPESFANIISAILRQLKILRKARRPACHVRRHPSDKKSPLLLISVQYPDVRHEWRVGPQSSRHACDALAEHGTFHGRTMSATLEGCSSVPRQGNCYRASVRHRKTACTLDQVEVPNGNVTLRVCG